MGVVLPGGLTGLMNQPSAQVIDGSLNFNQIAEPCLTRSLGSSGNRSTWTVSLWAKLTPNTTTYNPFFMGSTDNMQWEYETLVYANSNLYYIDYISQAGGANILLRTNDNFRDNGGWYHIVVQKVSNAGGIKLYVNNRLLDSFSSNTNNGGQSTHWNTTGATQSIGNDPGGQSTPNSQMSQFYFIDGLALGPGYFGFTDPLTNTWRPKKYEGTFGIVGDYVISGGSNYLNREPADMFDGSTSTYWQAAASGDRYQLMTFPTPKTGTTIELSVLASNGWDGFEINGSVPSGLPSVGSQSWFNITTHTSGSLSSIRIAYTAGLETQLVYALRIDGTIITGQTERPSASNSFYLPMDGNSPIGEDKSGQGNDWTAVNFSGTSNDPDVVKDSPSGAVSGGRAQTGITTTSSAPSNYATLNPLQMSPNRTPTISDGNLSISLSSGSSEWTNTGCTMNIGSGKYYWEVQFTTINGTIARIGVADSNNYEFNRNTASSGLPWLGSGTGVSWSLDVGGNTYYNGSTVNASYTSTIITSDIIGVLLDLDNNTLSFSKNGTNLGVAHSNVTSDFVTPGFGLHGGTTNTINVNFGQKPFKYAPPQGYLPLNSASATPETVITRPDQYFGTTLYTGNNGTQNINAGLKPDFVWIKNRSSSATDGNHLLFDTIRGVQNAIYSNLVDDQDTLTNSLTSFNSDGFTVGGPGASGNIDSQNYVAWTWRAGGAPTATNDNTSGAMDSNSVSLDGVLQSAYTPSGSPTLYPKKMSIGTRQGFSIMEYEGPGSAKSLPHGLNSAPEFIMVKRLDANASWALYHVGLGNTKVIELNNSGSPNTSSSVWNSTTPTSSVWSIGNYADTGDSGGDYVAYLWHSVPGLQKFGTYVGNANTDGTYVELGFRPRWIMQKNTSGQEWFIHDTARDPINVAGFRLTADLTAAENGTNNTWLDILSNGFKLRTTNEAGNSGTFIYMAWAEAPASNLYGGQSNAR